MSTISVIIVTYQSEDLIGPILDALMNDTAGDPEIIVVDNASSDATTTIVEDRGLKVLRQTTNLGFAVACHVGADAATGDTLVFLGHDTRPSPGWLRPLVEAVGDPTIGASMATIEDAARPGTFNTSGGHLTYYGLAWVSDLGTRIPDDEGELSDVAFPSGAAMAIRRVVWETFSGFRESLFMYHEDSDLGWRLRMAGLRVVRVTSSRVIHDYDFSRAPEKMYWLERNRHILLSTNYRFPTRVLLSPAFFVADVGVWVIAKRDGWLSEKVRAKREAFASRDQRSIERLSVNKTRILGDAAMVRTMDTSVSDIRQIATPRGVQIVDRVLSSYLRGVLPLIAFFDRRAGFDA